MYAFSAFLALLKRHRPFSQPHISVFPSFHLHFPHFPGNAQESCFPRRVLYRNRRIILLTEFIFLDLFLLSITSYLEMNVLSLSGPALESLFNIFLIMVLVSGLLCEIYRLCHPVCLGVLSERQIEAQFCYRLYNPPSLAIRLLTRD